VLTEIQATSHVPSVPSSVASPAVLKHTFWSETSWSLTANHFPQILLSLPCWRGVLLGRWGLHSLWAHTGSSAVAVWPPSEIRTSPDTLPIKMPSMSMTPALPPACCPGPDAPLFPTSQLSALSWQPLLQCSSATRSKQGVCKCQQLLRKQASTNAISICPLHCGLGASPWAHAPGGGSPGFLQTSC